MSYRDDLEAAQARADAAEARSRRLEQQLIASQHQARPKLDGPMIAIPERFLVEHSDGQLRIEWSWFRFATHVPLFCFCLMWNGALVVMYLAMSRAPALGHSGPLFLLGHAAAGACLSYAVLAGFVNRTKVVATAEGLELAHGPLPWRGNRKLARTELQQLFVTVDTGAKVRHWDLCALLTSGHQLRLLHRIDEADQAFYLEQQLEQQLGIYNHVVSSEAVRPSAGESPPR